MSSNVTDGMAQRVSHGRRRSERSYSSLFKLSIIVFAWSHREDFATNASHSGYYESILAQVYTGQRISVVINKFCYDCRGAIPPRETNLSLDVSGKHNLARILCPMSDDSLLRNSHLHLLLSVATEVFILIAI